MSVVDKVKILSDYTPNESPNILTMSLDDQGDINITLFEGSKNNLFPENGIRIAASGTRHSPEARQAFIKFMEEYKKAICDEYSNKSLRELNNL
jgi:hypothetical protein